MTAHETEAELVVVDEPRSERSVHVGELVTAAAFLASLACVVGFVVVFVAVDPHARAYSICLGTLLGLAFTLVGVGFIVWAKYVMPQEHAVQARHPLPSTVEDRSAAGAVMAQALDETQLLKRPLLRRTLLAAMGLLPVPFLVSLRDLGTAPKDSLLHTSWSKGARMVNQFGVPVKIGDIELGGFMTVFPEGHEDKADSQTLLIRLRPGEDKPRAGREKWSVDGHVAYSKICTHAGCPVGLYEQQSHHLLCPCHQSTFDVVDGCRPVFGPATRSLPQLAISVDDEGYFVAQGDYDQPVGPGFWERKP